MAENVANKMTAKRSEEITQLENEYRKILTDAYRESVPVEIMKAMKSNRGFLNMASGISLVGNGFNFDHIRFSEDLPSENSRWEIPEPYAEMVSTLRAHASSKKKELSVLKREITTALVNLRTLAKVSEHFPEALPFIERAPNTEIIVDLSSLRKKL